MKEQDILADSTNNGAKTRKIDDGKKEMQNLLNFIRVNQETEISTKLKEINLVQPQIRVMTECLEWCPDPERKADYKKGLVDLDDRLYALLY